MSIRLESIASAAAQRAIVRYALASTGGHLVWEFAHLPLYTIWAEDRRAALSAAAHCWLGDLLIAGGALTVALIVAGRGWPASATARATVAVITIAGGLLFTIASEIWNVQYAGAWAYAEAMPVIVGIGLSPVVQWIVVPGLALAIAAKAQT